MMDGEYTFERGYVIYPEATGDDPSAKAPYRDVGSGIIAPQRYFDSQQADLEWDKLWTMTWCWAAVAQDLDKVGDFVRFDIGRESFVIVKSAPDHIQAFYNVCPHRGNYLVTDDFGNIGDGASLYCKFHGWRFNLDGSLRAIKDRHTFHAETLCGAESLKEVRCEIWSGLVFINMDENAPPLMEQLGIVVPHLENYDFSKMRIYNDVQGTIDANWKTALEAFIEFYHADDTHPQVIPITSTLKTQYDLYDHGVSRMIIPTGYSGDRAADPSIVTDTLKGFIAFFGGNNDDYSMIDGGDYRVAFADTMRKWARRNGHSDLFDRLTDGQVTDDWNYHLFPNVTLNIFSHSLLIQSWVPHATDAEKCVYRALSLVLPVSDPEQHVMDPASFAVSAEKGWTGTDRPARIYPEKLEDWGTVLAQDVERLPMVQRGLRSRSYDGNRLGESECRIRHYLQEVDKYLNAAL